MKHSMIVSRNQEMITFLRERYLGDEWMITDRPSEAIAALAKEPFDRIFLDHWLGSGTAPGTTEEYNGRDVTRYLGANPDCNPLVQIIATTTDVEKARKMIAESGRVTYHIPPSVIMALGA